MAEDKLEFVEIKGEKSRRYKFAKGDVVVNNVVKLCVRPSGNHRLETSDGKKHIIKGDWLGIEIEAEAWSA